MNKAIGLRFVPYDEAKHLRNHVLGKPILPENMIDDLGDDVFFFGVFDCAKLAPLDHENRLPHKGYLYVFFDTSASSRQMKPIVRYAEEEPMAVVDDFNDELAKGEYEGIDKPMGVEFHEVDENYDGCKLLGVPCDWNYPDPPKTPLLLSVSHYDENLDFLPELDGYTYVFFGPKGEEFSGSYGYGEYS